MLLASFIDLSISNSFTNSFGILVFFLKKTQKPLFRELAKEWAISAYMRASSNRASAWHRSFSRGSSLLSGPLRFLAGLLGFWNEICQTVGDAILFSSPYYFRSWQTIRFEKPNLANCRRCLIKIDPHESCPITIFFYDGVSNIIFILRWSRSNN
jgi:hypothetical protein